MFAMRMKLNDEIIKKDSFEDLYINGKKNGFCFDLQLAYYRGHYLSDIEEFELYVNGEKISEEAITFTLKNKEMPIYKLKYAITEFWSQVDKATVKVIMLDGLEEGTYEVQLKLLLRIPYMELDENHNYMNLDSGETVTIEIVGKE